MRFRIVDIERAILELLELNCLSPEGSQPGGGFRDGVSEEAAVYRTARTASVIGRTRRQRCPRVRHPLAIQSRQAPTRGLQYLARRLRE